MKSEIPDWLTPDQVLTFHGESERRMVALKGEQRKRAQRHLVHRGDEGSGDVPTLRDQIEHALRRRLPMVRLAATMAAEGRLAVLTAERVNDPVDRLHAEWRGFLVACEAEREGGR